MKKKKKTIGTRVHSDVSHGPMTFMYADRAPAESKIMKHFTNVLNFSPPEARARACETSATCIELIR